MIAYDFLKETKNELSKVTWPKRDQLISLSKTVILVSIVVSVYLGALDYFFNELIQIVLKS